MKIFGDIKELERVSRCQDLKYMKLLRSFLMLISAWPCRQLGEPVPKIMKYYKAFLACFTPFTLVLASMYIKNNISILPLFEMGQTYITMLMNIISATRTILIFMDGYFNITADFVNKVHLYNFMPESDYARDVRNQVHKLCHFFTFGVAVETIIAINLFNFIPIYNNIVAGAFGSNPDNIPYELSIYYELPFDYVHSFKGYIVMYFVNFYISCKCSSFFCTIDCLLSIMIFNLWGHLKIHIYNITSFPRPKHTTNYNNLKITWYSDEENKAVFNQLKKIIEYHRLINDFATRMSKIFGPHLFMYYAFHQVSGCILLLECSQLETKALLRYGPLTLILTQQLIQLSIVFELLGSVGDRVQDAVYSIPWECMNTSNRKLLYIMLHQSGKSLNVKAMGMVPVGVQSMAAILRTSVSYFVLLRTFA